jgi:cytochrome c553
MTLRKVDWLFVLFAIVVVIGVSMLPTPKDRNPMIPKSAEHQAITNEKDCVRCHQADGVKPVPARHPKRQDCFRCHARHT